MVIVRLRMPGYKKISDVRKRLCDNGFRFSQNTSVDYSYGTSTFVNKNLDDLYLVRPDVHDPVIMIGLGDDVTFIGSAACVREALLLIGVEEEIIKRVGL